MTALDVKNLVLKYDLKIGETNPNVDCPFCKSGEASFSMTRTPAGIVYNCFRAKCGAKGFVSLMPHSMLDVHHASTKKFEPKEFKYPLRNFSDEELSEHFGKYELSKYLLVENGFRYDYCNGRVHMPIRSYESAEIGAVAKMLPNSVWTGPKAVAYWTKDYPKVHFADIQVRVPEWCAVVEDIISSVKVSQIIECAALLGTHMSADVALEIRKHFRNLLVMLDPGAEDKATKIIHSYKLYFDTIKIVLLEKDPKDTPYEELKGAILGTISTRSNAQ